MSQDDRRFDPLYRFDEVEPLVDQALERPRSDWSAFLATIADADLRSAVQQLLERVEDEQDHTEASWSIEASPPPPSNIAGYRILETLGEGGMSHVHLAVRHDDELQQEVALKIQKTATLDPSLRARFRAEGRMLAELNHAAIARVLDSGQIDEGDGSARGFLVLERVDGRPIDQYCKDRRLTLRQLLELFVRCCEGVDYAHRRLIVHRDIKPSNLLVTEQGDPKLLDFGIAKMLDQEPGRHPATPVTRTHQRLMTPEYAAPEQLRGGEITTATDVWGLGVVLYELLTGERPFAGKDLPALEQAILSNEPQTASQQLRHTAAPAPADGEKQWDRGWGWQKVRGDLDVILQKALSKEPERRYQSVAAFAGDLSRFLDGRPIAARPATAGYRLRKLVRRNPLATGIAAASILATTALIVVLATQVRAKDTALEQARRETLRAQTTTDFLVGLFRAGDPYVNLGEESTAGDLLQRGVGQLEQLDEPLVRAELQIVLGEVYRSLENPDTAVDLLESAVTTLEATYREQPATTTLPLGRALTQLARVRFGLNQPESGLRHIERALQVLPETARPERASAFWALALSERQQGNLESALGHYQQAIDLDPGDSPWFSVQTKTSMARALTENGDLERSVRVLEQALTVAKQELGERSPVTASASENLGDALAKLNRLEEASTHLEHAKAVVDAVFGPDHPRFGRLVATLGVLYARQGRWQEALEAHRTAAAAALEKYGPRHPTAAINRTSICATLVSMGRLEEAIAECRAGVAAGRAAGPGPDSRYTANALKFLGLAQWANRELEAAAQSLRASEAMFGRTVGLEAPIANQSTGLLGGVLLDLGETEESLESLQRAEALQGSQMGESHATTLMTRSWRLVAEGRIADPSFAPGGSAALREILETLAQALPPGHSFYRISAGLLDLSDEPTLQPRTRRRDER